MHSSLDQFDAMLSSFEAELELSESPCPPPPPASELTDEDALLKHDLREGVESYSSMVRARCTTPSEQEESIHFCM
jgi:hypothetical protein